MLALLRGLYPATANYRLTVDGHQGYSLEHLSNTVTLLPQEPKVFENTIEYNITLGLPFAEAEVNRAIAITNFAEVVDQLPSGLTTNIKEKGVNLSGGQKQRLALARGVLAARESSIVLLDEPTSSVDPRSELVIYDRLFEAFSEKAVISSLHRLHLLPKFDYIYVMEKGRIVAEGAFDDLRKNSPAFQELWQHQEEMV